MRAFVMTRYGGPESMEFRDVATPEAGPGQVLIRVHAVALNPIDYKIRQGKVRVIHRPALPIVAGNELSGTVAAVGPGVSRFAVGDRVFTRLDQECLGAFAEFAAVAEDLVAIMPSSVAFAEAAGVPLAGLTALQALRDELSVTDGTRLLITGGAGGVGTFAIQLAKWLGAYVATTASPRGTELVLRLGADLVIDYTEDDISAAIQDYDAVFDLIGGRALTDAMTILRPGGTVVSIAGMPEPTTARKDLHRGPALAALFWLASFGLRRRARRHHVGYRYLLMHGSGSELAELARLIDEKKIEIVLDRTFPFDQIADAFAYLEQGRAKGKVVVTLLD